MNRLVYVLLLGLVTFGMTRVLFLEIPTLPWEKAPQGTPSPHATVSPRASFRIGVSDRPASLPFFALKRRLPQEIGQLLEVVTIPDARMRWEMLAAGRIDMACGTMDSLALALSRKMKATLIFVVGTGVSEDAIVAGAGVKRVADLKGKTVAVPAGGPGLYLLGMLLGQSGVAVNETRIVYTRTVPEALELLQGSKVDAAVLSDPSIAAARDKGFQVQASTADGNAKAFRPQEVCAVREGVLKEEERRQQLVWILETWFQNMDRLKQNPSLLRNFISNETGYTAGQVTNLMDEVEFMTLSDNRNLSPQVLGQQLRDFQDNLQLMGEKNAAPLDETDRFIHLDILAEVR